MKPKPFLFALFAFLSLVAYQKYSEYTGLKSIDSYESCLASKGSVIQESYPATCVTRLGSHFIQPAPGPSQLPISAIPISPAKPYGDYSKDYRLSLPSGWHQEGNMFLNYIVNETDNNFKPKEDSGKLKIEVIRLNDVEDLTEALTSVKVYDGQTYLDQKITLDKQPAILVESEDGFYKSSTVLVSNPHTKDIYSIEFGLDFYNFKPLRDQILSTFKFTN